MAVDLDKRSLFVGRNLRRELRPPGALDEERFVEACTRCAACIEVCPTQIITQGSGGYPVLDFSEEGCLFCGECQSACNDGALNADRVAFWPYKASINEHCLNDKGVFCQSCRDACEYDALNFVYGLSASNKMELISDQCTGCGACLGTCPVSAIALCASSQE